MDVQASAGNVGAPSFPDWLALKERNKDDDDAPEYANARNYVEGYSKLANREDPVVQ